MTPLDGGPGSTAVGPAEGHRTREKSDQHREGRHPKTGIGTTSIKKAGDPAKFVGKSMHHRRTVDHRLMREELVEAFAIQLNSPACNTGEELKVRTEKASKAIRKISGKNCNPKHAFKQCCADRDRVVTENQACNMAAEDSTQGFNIKKMIKMPPRGQLWKQSSEQGHVLATKTGPTSPMRRVAHSPL